MVGLVRVGVGLFAALSISGCVVTESSDDPEVGGSSFGDSGVDPAVCEDEEHARRQCIYVEGDCPDCSETDCATLIYEATLCRPDRVDADCGPGQAENSCCFIVGGGETCDGRPFVVNGHKRTSRVVQRADWGADVTTDAPRVDWLERALDEHASVAAFARFVLELLAVGAPPELIADAAAAMQDEVEHARLCFAVAGHACGPGPLPTADAVVHADLETIARATLIEGAIGETLAAVRAAREADVESDPHVRAILERIEADETRHAALAWRVVAWAVGERPELEPVLAAAFDEALALADVPDVELALLRPCYVNMVGRALQAA